MEWTMRDFTEELAIEWLRKPCWSIAEAVFLLGETQIPVSKLAGYPLPPEFAGNAGSALDRLIRAIQTRQLQPIASVEGSIRGRFPIYAPADVIRVAEEINFGNWKSWKLRLEANKGADTKQTEVKTPQGEINQESLNHEETCPASAANVANRFVEKVIMEMEKSNVKVTLTKIWVELGKRNGSSIIEDSKPDGFLCNVGESDLHELKKGAVKGVLQRRRKRQRNA